ncbi:cytochrome c peroxidase [Hymenobacter canadensis]|uniref:Cytochrome-c peroxidase n=1 Tax=Hymenobacter canadensis TaxID=2999067 RepID=A0ABY7LSB4_9BACT|nr:cytochrome c peroxidase [Hymenobacter canadensis]WBA43318.1 cytochrome-c peroxidase [Hymenobacter canadensis]
MNKLLILLAAALLLVWASCQRPSTPAAASEPAPTPAGQVLRQYRRHLTALDSAVAGLRRAVATGQPAARQRQAFLAARLAWKRVELLAEYYSPSTAKALNGPALGEVEEFDQQQRVRAPEGLQVLETYFYPALYAPDRRPEVLEQLALVRSSLLGLRHAATSLTLTDRHVFDAARLEVFRVMTLGIPGFDTPASPGAVAEAAAALATVQATVAPYRAGLPAPTATRLDSLFRATLGYLHHHPDAARFDRLTFLARYAHPLSQQLWATQQALGIAAFPETRALRADAPSLFAPDVFEPAAFAPSTTERPTPAQVALGRQLFFDPVLSGNGGRSCASCHQPARAFTDGQARSVAFGGQGAVARNAPTLLNAALQRTQFHDGRVSFLEDQAAAVLANPTEMHGSMAAAARLLTRSPAYRAAFARAFDTAPAAPVQEAQLKTALATYLRSLVRLNSPFDRYLRGEATALSPAAQRGANVFLGKAKCATCHFLPLFNGTVPPGFERTENEVLGTLAAPNRLRLDADPGRAGTTGIRWQEHAFKTPTLRNIALTAPYMHQGTYRTLAEVVEFYNQGGGAGRGLAVPNQTLPPDPLHLTPREKQDLLAFLHALTDTTGLHQETPRRLPSFPAEMARLNQRPVGGRY